MNMPSISKTKKLSQVIARLKYNLKNYTFKIMIKNRNIGPVLMMSLKPPEYGSSKRPLFRLIREFEFCFSDSIMIAFQTFFVDMEKICLTGFITL